MKKFFLIPLFAALFSFVSAGASAQTVDVNAPDALIKTATQQVMDAIRNDKSIQQGDITHITALVKETSGPKMVYRIGMGVRSADQNWKRQLNRLIQENQPAINKILLDFGVPLLDENDQPINAETATKSP